jgi:outer membrane lipoprotein-sorting protein
MDAMTTSAHKQVKTAAHEVGKAVQNLLTESEEGLEKALQLALKNKSSLISEYNGYKIVISNPVRAFVSTVGPGGILVSDGNNSVSFDPSSGILMTDGEVHSLGGYYWDLGARDDEDGLFIVKIPK